MRGLWLPPVPPSLPLFVAMGPTPGEVKPDRSRLLISRHRRAPARVEVDGLPLAPIPDALLACARWLGVLDLVVLTDSALHLGHCAIDEAHAAAAPHRKGAPALRLALSVADGRSESPWETLLRVLHVVLGVEVIPQQRIVDAEGEFAGRVDLLLEGTRTAHEYDGAHHRTAEQHRKDLARERRLLAAGATRRGYTSDVLLHNPVAILRDCERTLGKRIALSRLDAWHALLRSSLFTASGERAVRRRIAEGCWSRS